MLVLLLIDVFLLFTTSTRVRCAATAPYDDDVASIFYDSTMGNVFGINERTSDSIDQFTDAPLYEVRNLVTLMDLDKPTVFYIHGYTGSVNSIDTVAVVTAYLERRDHNAIGMDWRRLAGKNYPSVVNSAKLVGNVLAGAIDEMIDQGLPAGNVHVVGHSMGAQIAGHIGRRTSVQLDRITGLDPAGPLFNILGAHLTEKDAKFVDTIHTDSGRYGISRTSGAASFYPNGGRRVQPGCPINFEFQSPDDYCSHHRSWLFYAESLRNEQSFVATTCDTYRAYARGECNENTKVPMGYATPTNTRGVFYLRTRNETPFGMQMEGATAAVSHLK